MLFSQKASFYLPVVALQPITSNLNAIWADQSKGWIRMYLAIIGHPNMFVISSSSSLVFPIYTYKLRFLKKTLLYIHVFVGVLNIFKSYRLYKMVLTTSFPLWSLMVWYVIPSTLYRTLYLVTFWWQHWSCVLTLRPCVTTPLITLTELNSACIYINRKRDFWGLKRLIRFSRSNKKYIQINHFTVLQALSGPHKDLPISSFVNYKEKCILTNEKAGRHPDIYQW